MQITYDMSYQVKVFEPPRVKSISDGPLHMIMPTDDGVILSIPVGNDRRRNAHVTLDTDELTRVMRLLRENAPQMFATIMRGLT